MSTKTLPIALTISFDPRENGAQEGAEEMLRWLAALVEHTPFVPIIFEPRREGDKP